MSNANGPEMAAAERIAELEAKLAEALTGPSGLNVWSLEHDDCLERLPALSRGCVDHVITDPPYSARVHAGKGLERRSDGGKVEALAFAHLDAGMRQALALHFARIARRWIVIFADLEGVAGWKEDLEVAGAEWCVAGVWVKEAPAPRMDGTRPAYGAEAICIAHAPREAGKTRWNGGGRPAVYVANPQEQERTHPAQKPLSLMEALVRDFTDPGDLVCDPFVGSGTTGVACRRLGRRFVGWELDAAHHAEAFRRISGAREQMRLFEGG